MSKVQEVIDIVKELTVLELSELVKALEEEFGVSAAAPVAVAAAGPAADAGAAAEEEAKTEFDVVLTSVGDKKINVFGGNGGESDVDPFMEKLFGDLQARSGSRNRDDQVWTVGRFPELANVFGGLSWLIEAFDRVSSRSEERRVGKECRSRWSPYH